MKPIPFDPNQLSLNQFKDRHQILRVVDAYDSMLNELFLIRNPRFRFDPMDSVAQASFVDAHRAGRTMSECGAWFYFPWNKTLTHFLSDELHRELHTARNRYLITSEEQDKFHDFKVGIAGLSVGSHAAMTIAMMGGARHMRLADPDHISGSNLNRIRLDYTYVGMNKCDVVTQLIYQTNPYAEITACPEGLSAESLEQFMFGLDVFVECMDQPELKIRSRLIARELGIPVLMATDNGDGIIFDVERYDLDPSTELFNGAAGPISLAELQKYPQRDLPQLATRIAGIEIVDTRMLHSVSEIGKSLYSWPQLGDAATLTGVVVAYAVKRLANRLPLRSGRTEVNLDAIFDPLYEEPEASMERAKRRKKYLQAIGFNLQ